MADLKEIFESAENGTLTYEQFVEAAKAVGAKFKDVSSGEYVSKAKYEADLEAKAGEIKTLNDTITTRDTDLANLKSQLESAGTDATKLETLSNDMKKLQGKYDADVKKYQEQLQKQAYEFAVKEYANTLQFSSEAAKRDFTTQLTKAELKMEEGKLIGAADFKEMYSANNADAFKIETPATPPAPEPTPRFAGPAPGSQENPVQMTLTELMKAKNENPDLSIQFTD